MLALDEGDQLGDAHEYEHAHEHASLGVLLAIFEYSTVLVRGRFHAAACSNTKNVQLGCSLDNLDTTTVRFPSRASWQSNNPSS